ncbi:MAG: hypothetical protein WDZ31_04920 [Phycisphaeraceae bacterium]
MSGQTWNSFVQWMMPVFLLGGPAVLVWLTWRAIRRRRWAGMPGGDDLPRAAPSPVRLARLVETVALAALGLVIFALIATEPHTSGLLLRLDELPAYVAERQKAAALIAGMGFFGLLLLAAAGRTSSAACLLAGLFVAYAIVLNVTGWASPPRSGGTVVGPVQYTIQLTETNATGADLWVNGVYLGKTPIEMTLAEFHQKVPHWSDPPVDDEPLQVTQYRRAGTSIREYSPWIRFRASTLSGGAIGEPEAYYARVMLGDEVGYAGGGSSSGSGSGTSSGPHASSSFDVIFPERQRRLDALLNQARLADYQPTAAWFEAMQSYDEDGWLAVRRAAEDEPAMLTVLDAWARWRYDLDAVRNAASAWAVFERIGDEAQQAQQYISASVAGHALEQLTPYLDPARLAERAELIIERTGSYRGFTFRMNGRDHLGTSRRPHPPYLGVRTSSYYIGIGAGNELPVRDHVLAHAVWQVDEHLDQRGTATNPLEARLTPALIRRAYGSQPDRPLRMAMRLGGPVIERFLLRMAARQDPPSDDWHDQIHLSGGAVNRWLYLAAHLPGPGGDAFRHTHRDQLFEMAGRILVRHSFRDDDLPDYLFMDLHRGASSMAMQYWPRFDNVADQHRHRYDALKGRWQYLIRMEPASSAAMYVDAWRSYEQDYSWRSEAIQLLGALPADKREAVAELLREEVHRLEDEGDRQYLLRELETLDPTAARQAEAERFMAQLHAGELTQAKRTHLVNWLTHEAPRHPLVTMLAEASDPALRRMAVPPLAALPTPGRRVVLEKLAADDDAAVRTAARAAWEQWADLSATDPQTLAATRPAANAHDAEPSRGP